MTRRLMLDFVLLAFVAGLAFAEQPIESPGAHDAIGSPNPQHFGRVPPPELGTNPQKPPALDEQPIPSPSEHDAVGSPYPQHFGRVPPPEPGANPPSPSALDEQPVEGPSNHDAIGSPNPQHFGRLPPPELGANFPGVELPEKPVGWPSRRAEVSRRPVHDGQQGNSSESPFIRFDDPHPFRDQTGIHYHLAGSAPVRVEIYSLSGRLVWSAALGRQQPGANCIYWNGRDDRNREVGPGSYICRIAAPMGGATCRLLKLD